MKPILFAACLLLSPAAVAGVGAAEIISNLTFAVVPKNKNNVFFSVVEEGCRARSSLLPNVDCLYVGPEDEDPVAQAAFVDAIINGTYGRVDGISISVSDPSVVAPAIDRAIEAGIPVITFDSDASGSNRRAYIGTDNLSFGLELGKLLDQLAPMGGRYGIIAAAAPNVLQRVNGVRERLASTKWVEIESSYKDCHDSIPRAMDLMYEFAKEGVDAIIPVGGWPMWDERWTDFVDANRETMLVVGDALPVQIELMNKGYVNGLVGQLPFQMGEMSIDVLLKIARNEEVDETIYGTAFLEVMRFPLVLPELHVNENYIGGLAALGYALFAVIAVASLGFMILTYTQRKKRVFKASQPFFLQMIIVGVLIFASAIVPLSFDTGHHSQEVSDAACMTTPWLLTVGFTTVFSALFTKTWRVNKIFHNPNAFSRIKVTEKDVMKPYLVMMSLNVIVLACWTAIAPLTSQRFDAEGTDEWNRVIATYGVCTSKSETRDATAFFPYVILLLVINISLLVVANVQSYQARSIQTEYSESKYITIIMASMLQAFALGVPCICLLWNIPRAYYIVMVMVIFCICSVVLGFMFLPKIIHAKEWAREKAEKDRMAASLRRRVMGNGANGVDGAEPAPSETHGDGLKIAVMAQPRFTSLPKAPPGSRRDIKHSSIRLSSCKHDKELNEEEDSLFHDCVSSEGGIEIVGNTLKMGEDGVNRSLDEALQEIRELIEQHQWSLEQVKDLREHLTALKC